MAALRLLVWFFVGFLVVVVPSFAFAATFNPTPLLTGAATGKLGPAGSGIGSASSVLLSAGMMAGRANPWGAAIGVGSTLFELLLAKPANLTEPGAVLIRPPNAPRPVPPGWSPNPANPALPIPPATTAPAGDLQTTPATTNTVYGPTSGFTSGAQGTVGSYGTADSACKAKYGASYWAEGSNGGFGTYCRYSGGAIGGTAWKGCPGVTASAAVSPGLVDTGGGNVMCYYGGSAQKCPDTSWTLNGTTCSKGNYTCPAGYTLAGSICNLTNQSLVPFPSDGNSGMTVDDAGNLVPDPRDPDSAANEDLQNEIKNTADRIRADEYGNPTSTTVTPQVGGGITYETKIQTTTNNQTYTTINNMTVNNSGTVTNISTTTVPGPIGSASSSQTPQQPLPDDYNREATQQQVLEALKPGNVPATVSAGAGDAMTTAYDGIKGTINGIKDGGLDAHGVSFNWAFTVPEATCSPWTYHVAGRDIVIDPCPVATKIRDIGAYVLYFLTALTLASILFGTRQEA